MSALVAPGARVAVVAPCHVHDPQKLERGLAIARERGVTLDVWPELLRPHRYFAADDAQRLRHLDEAMASREHAAVWIVRGGSGLGRLLGRLQPAGWAPKVVIGFSDVTALFCRLAGHLEHTLVHGPVLHSLPATDASSTDALFALLAGERPAPWAGEGWIPGVAEGPVVGGNLTLLASLCGTPWQPDLRGRIVLLEEVSEAPYRIDRLLQQLVDAGVFAGVRGVGVGINVGCAPPEGAPWTLRDVFAEVLGPLGVPVVGELPFGHGPKNTAFRWRAHARLADGTLSWE